MAGAADPDDATSNPIANAPRDIRMCSPFLATPQTIVRFGSVVDICGAKRHVRFTPNSGHVQRKGERTDKAAY